MRRVWGVVLLGSVMFGCAPAAREPGPAPPVDPAQLRRVMATLPGARVGEGEPPTVSYPGEVLFSAGAAIPLAGGTALLDPLASFLEAQPGVRWRATVRARTEEGERHDRALAEKRGEMLMRYFLFRGVPRERIEIVPEEGEGPPLELVPLHPAREASSSRPKR